MIDAIIEILFHDPEDMYRKNNLVVAHEFIIYFVQECNAISTFNHPIAQP